MRRVPPISETQMGYRPYTWRRHLRAAGYTTNGGKGNTQPDVSAIVHSAGFFPFGFQMLKGQQCRKQRVGRALARRLGTGNRDWEQDRYRGTVDPRIQFVVHSQLFRSLRQSVSAVSAQQPPIAKTGNLWHSCLQHEFSFGGCSEMIN
jgi:hypothetical protein